MTKHLCTNRRALRADIASSRNWCDLADTVDAVPGRLVIAWAELVDGYDDDALCSWTQFLHGFPDLDSCDTARSS